MKDNKDIVLDWLHATLLGDVEAVRRLFAEDCRFLVAGDMPYCGWMDREAFFKQTMILPLGGPITLEIGDITAAGERVWFEAQSYARLKNGSAYENAYVFFMRIRNGQIIEYKEFTDTYYVYRSIDSPQTRNAPQPRYRIFDIPSHTFRGDSISQTLRGKDGADT
jgi:ketosteroid isomerase-like protein